MEVSTHKSSGMFSKELEDELMKFTMKSEDYGVEGRLAKKSDQVQKNNSDVEVNITECTRFMGNKSVVPEYQDLTESEGSSSFDETDSDFENVDSLGDSEVLSEFCGDSALGFDGFGDSFRRKKLTAHWRTFIQPIMWRCKWTELQIKKLQSLAQKYDRELEAHNKPKLIQVEDSTLIDGVKSLPFSRMNAVNDLVKRKRRRMTEATTDVAEYMSRHNLFSYYENKKSSTEGAIMSNLPKVSATPKVNIDDEFWANDDLSSFFAGDGANSLEDILRKIEILQSQAGQLRSRLDRVISENADKILSAEKSGLPMPFDASHASSGDGIAVGTYITSQLISEYNMGDDVLLPESSAVTNHGDGALNARADVDHARFPDAYRNVEDGALIDNRRVKEEMNNFDEVIINPIQKPPVVKKPNLSPTDNQSPSKIRTIAKITAPRSKRKRGRKKGARRRTRRISG